MGFLNTWLGHAQIGHVFFNACVWFDVHHFSRFDVLCFIYSAVFNAWSACSIWAQVFNTWDFQYMGFLNTWLGHAQIGHVFVNACVWFKVHHFRRFEILCTNYSAVFDTWSAC